MDDYIDHEMLQIPAHIAASILPASAKSLSTTVLPAIDKSLRCEFSNNPPTSMNMEVFSRQDIPSGETIGRMEAGFGAALAKGCQSIFVRARNAWHPLWVLSFWRQVQHIALPEQKDWQRSLCWIDRLEASGDKDTIQSLLLTFPWAGDLLEVGGFQSDRVSMTRMLSDRWSNDYSQNLLLGLIQDQLGTDISSHVVLINAELLRSLEILAATNVSTGALDGFLNVLGTRDVAGFHCREKHWRAFCTSRATQQVAFGDSLQETEMRRYKAIHINTDFRELWEWFFLQYPVAGVVSVKPVGIRMRTSPQELAIDWFSCGFLSANALREYLAHRFTHTEMLILVGETKEARDRFRLKSAIAVLQRAGSSLAGPSTSVQQPPTPPTQAEGSPLVRPMSAMLVGPKLGRDSEEDLNMIGLSSHPNSLYQYPWSQKFSSGDELAISDDADMHDVSIDDAFALARSADAGMPGGETKSMSIAVPQGGRSTSDEKVQTPPPACIVNPMTPRSIAHQLFPTPEREAGLGEMAASASQPVASDGKRAEAIAMLRRWREGPLAAYHEGVLRAEAEIVTGHTEAAREFQEELDAVYAEIRRLNGV